MPENDKQKHTSQSHRSNGSLLTAIIAVVALFLLMAGAIFYLLDDAEQDPLPQQQTAQEPLDKTPDVVVTKQESLRTTQTEQSPDPRPVEPRTEEEPVQAEQILTEEEKLAAQCNTVAGKLSTFFTHIDGRDYIHEYELQETSQAHFTSLAYKLLDNPPVVSRESDDLYTILRNMAHFFRIIGKNNILLIKTILDRERDKIEDVASDLYFWTTTAGCKSEQFTFAPTLEKMYEYAGFFLNTMGGRSYLFRRDSRSRLLVNYYSILLIDLANAQGLNRHGIDISLAIQQLVQEIESSNQLIYKENYLDQLYDLLEQYQNP